MSEEQSDSVRFELIRAIGALQDAYAFCLHAEELANAYGDGGLKMRISGLRSRVDAAADHAAIIVEVTRGAK